MVKLLVVSDIHNRLEPLEEWLEKRSLIDYLIVAGDLTNRMFNLDKILDFLSNNFDKIVLVPGNNEKPEVLRRLSEKYENIYYIHEKIVKLDDLLFFGFGGSKVTPFNTPFEWEESYAKKVLDLFVESINSYRNLKKVLVFHSPPINTIFDLYSGIGSFAIREFLGKVTYDLAIFGHVHEAEGIVQVKDGRVLVNGGKRGVLLEL